MIADAVLHHRVTRLHTRYVDLLDEGAFDAWPDLFTERCLYKIISRDDHAAGRPAGLVFCDSRGMLRDRIGSMRRANIFERHTYRHLTCALTVTTEPDGTLTATSNYLVVRVMGDGRQDVFSTGRYHDHLVEEGDDLRFRQRLVLCDSTRLDSLLVIPL